VTIATDVKFAEEQPKTILGAILAGKKPLERKTQITNKSLAHKGQGEDYDFRL